MTFPLSEKILIRGATEHVRANLGVGADYVAVYVPVYASFAGAVLLFDDLGGGKWIRITRSDGYRVELAHLDERFIHSGGQVSEGDVIAQSGNSGVLTTGPHSHVQVFDQQGRRVDPVLFFSGAALPNTQMNEDLEGWAIVENPGGERSFFKGGKKHKFAPGAFTSGVEHYLFVKNAKFIPAARYAMLPLGTLSAEAVLKGQRDW